MSACIPQIFRQFDLSRVLMRGAALCAVATMPIGQVSSQSTVYGPVDPDAAAKAAAAVAPPGIPAPLDAAAVQAQSYPALRAGAQSIRASEADVRAAQWLRFPSVVVQGLATESIGGNQLTNPVGANLQVDQPLWAGGRISGNIARARANQDLAEAQLDVNSQDITIRVLNAYYAIGQSLRREEILKQSLSEHERLVESMSRRVEQEVSPRSDLDLAQSRAAQVRQDLAITVAQRYVNLQRIRELVGNPSYDPGPPAVYDPKVHHPQTGSAVIQALACDPQQRRLRAQADVAKADTRIANASVLPQVSARYSRNEVTGNQVGLVLSAQTNGGLSNFAAAEGARAREQASILQIAVAERELRETVILDVVDNTTSRDRIQSSDIAVSSSQNVTDSFMRQFITGRRTWLDVMNAVRESAAARLGLVDAETTAMASAARLLLRTCQWRPDLQGPEHK